MCRHARLALTDLRGTRDTDRAIGTVGHFLSESAMANAKQDPPPKGIAEFVAHTSDAIGIQIQQSHLPGVIENTARLHTIAKQFLEFPLPEEVEDSGVFQP